MKTVLISFLLLQLFYLRHVYSTISIDCFQALNTSDCNETPIRVFSYYKPGSRCELEVWRGCPTENKFDTEEECSETCIFKSVEFENKVKHQLHAKCLLPEDLENCNEKLTHGFKYDKMLLDCVDVDTYCPSNIFEEKLECIQSCIRDLTLEEKMKLISTQQSKELDEILDTLSNSTVGNNGSLTQATNSDLLKTTNVGITNSNVETNTLDVTKIGEIITAKDAEVKKLVGEDTNTTEPYENKETDNNSTSANDETASIGNEVTGVTKENNANSTSNSESIKATTNENIITTLKAPKIKPNGKNTPPETENI